jgi:hypothetical protein
MRYPETATDNIILKLVFNYFIWLYICSLNSFYPNKNQMKCVTVVLTKNYHPKVQALCPEGGYCVPNK